ncbi:hypothetical protein F4604DRAFT_1940881 [Suillus subluteus]|nr:hypothetical protein F4604DRAFT_1940881 [Suillus subluteus]
MPLLLKSSIGTHPCITHVHLPLVQGLLVNAQDLLVDTQDLHTLAPHQRLINMNINHLHILLPPAYTLISILHLSQPSPQIAYSPPPTPHRGPFPRILLHLIMQHHPLFVLALLAFLQAEKIEIHLQAVLTHPVPEHADALQLTQEVLDAELWRYHEKKIKMDKGYFPEYKAQMSQVLCDDLYTFHMELKKTIIPIVKSAYDIFPKGTVTHKDDIQKYIIAATTKLLKTGDYLCIPNSSNGEWKFFVSQALMDGCLAFYYSNSKKTLKNTDKFSHTIPLNGLILVAAVMKGVLSGFSEPGTDKLPDLSAEKCRSDFNSLQRSVDKLMDIPEHREELDNMLTQWAKIGTGELVHGDWHDIMVCLSPREIPVFRQARANLYTNMSALQYKVLTFNNLKKLVETSFGFTPCTWQLDSAPSQLEKKDVFTISPTGSGKTLTFWILMLCNDGGITIIVTPLNILGAKNESEVCAMGFNAVNLTAATATDKVFKDIENLKY